MSDSHEPKTGFGVKKVTALNTTARTDIEYTLHFNKCINVNVKDRCVRNTVTQTSYLVKYFSMPNLLLSL